MKRKTPCRITEKLASLIHNARIKEVVVRGVKRYKIIPYRDVAKQANVSPSTVMRIELGYRPDIETFVKLCKWLGKSPNEVIGWKQKKK